MSRSRFRAVVSSLACLAAAGLAHAQEPAPADLRSDLARLQGDVAALRQEYAERLSSLEARIRALEAATAPTGAPAEAAPQAPPAPTPPPAATEIAVPAGAAGAGGPQGALPVYGNAAAASKIFNPDVAVIGNLLGAVGKNDAEPGPALEMSEAEASFQAIVDPYARADFFLSFGQEGVDLEEGYVTFSSLPGDLLMKAGKLKASFGKVNTFHSHVLPWTDEPLMMRNLLGGEEGFSDAGISLSRLIPNDFVFLEATGEVYRGESEGLFAAPRRHDLTYVGRLRAYRDLSDATNLDLGGSFAYGNNDAGPGFKTRLIGVDATFRFRPLRRAIYRRFLARAEAVWSRREAPDGRQDAFGGYFSGEYQLSRRWFAGARLDYAERAREPGLVDKGFSALLTYWPSEFSQIRGQYRLTRYAEGDDAHEFLFQFLFSIGAHGAHPF